MTGRPAIETSGLGKDYGRRRAVSVVDLRVAAGEVFGLLGPNGAGKTTILRVLMDLIRPTAGRARLLGLDARRDSVAVRSKVGYLPADFAVYPELTGHEVLRLCAGLRGHPDLATAHDLAHRLELELDRPWGELSRGNRQKLGLVQAFLHDPELVLLDEPSSGFDPLAQRVLHDWLRAYADRGGAVLLSSHALSEVERTADRIGVLLDGRLELVGRVDELTGAALREVEFSFATPVPAAVFEDLPGVREVTATGATVRCRFTGPVAELLRVAADHDPRSVTGHEPDLEDAFVDYVERHRTHAH
ncbi:ABC transporter ATP-binding protein [Actinokineospora sp. PR83]|uniref:ABC transporter ATP-binding protein n=1 Tax=Actinokineospora sp. PR83 TaxID=2884908 RepID=UPI001F24CCA9|nr:ABC transporter ATP-binding protein [Actinokineospora sp. PR83]MCG8917495.1 ABC transporter ATP-binding protein [Actinokineospora sp. PR83]